MTDISTQTITVETLLALGDTRAEVVDGELRIMSPNKVIHSFFSLNIGVFLSTFVKARNLGYVFGDMAGYILEQSEEGRIKGARVPDCSFVSYARLAPDADIDRMLPFAPDLAVEVISEGERASDIKRKVADYLRFGGQAVWLIYMAEERIRVCTPDNPTGSDLGLEDTLSGGAVLKGFEIPVRALFERENQALYVETLQKLLSPPSE